MINESADEWDNVTKNAAGATNAEISALNEGLNLRPMPDEIKADKDLIGAYLKGLQQEEKALAGLIETYKRNYELGEESDFYATTGYVLTAEDCDYEVSLMSKNLAVSEKLIGIAVSAKKALELSAFKIGLRENMSQLQDAVDANERFKKLFVDGVTQRTAMESYQLLKQHFSADGAVGFGDMLSMLDDCHRLMDAEEALTAQAKDADAFEYVDLATRKNNKVETLSGAEAMNSFFASDGYVTGGESVNDRPLPSKGMTN